MLLIPVFADAAAYFIVLFKHGNTGAALRESASRRETANAAANYDDVRRLQCFSTREDQCEVHRSACCDRFGEPHVQGALPRAFMRAGVKLSTLRVKSSQERDLQVRCCRIAAFARL